MLTLYYQYNKKVPMNVIGIPSGNIGVKNIVREIIWKYSDSNIGMSGVVPSYN